MQPRQSDPEPHRCLRLHGPPALGHDGRWQGLERKAAAVLAWLALRGPTTRRQLAELLWPSANEEASRNSLRQLLFKLRRSADGLLAEGSDPLQLADGWSIEPANGELLEAWSYDDCPQFDQWLTQARQDEARRRLSEALESIDADLAAGETGRALESTQRLLDRDPLCEPALLRQVQALYLAGRVTDALEAAKLAGQRLRDELDVQPGDALQTLRATLEHAAAGATGRVPVTVMRPPRLVGRRHELRQLAGAWADRRVALLEGEAGIGKSRLMSEHTGSVVGACLLGCRPGDVGVTYGALARWMRGLRTVHRQALDPLPAGLAPVLPELATATPHRGHADVAAGAAEVLARAAASGLTGLALDDLHYADTASLETLVQLIDHADLASLRWSLARRPAEGEPALRHLCDALLDGGELVPVALGPLDCDGMHELLEDLALPGLEAEPLATELWQATGGNPMFALETLKELVQQPAASARHGRDRLPRPANVAALVERRLRQLSPLALALARVAALAGPDFDATLAAHALQQPVLALADAWHELESAQVLREQAFAHDLIHEATLASVPAPVQRHVRRAVGEFLAARGGEPARIAAHFMGAGEPALAAPHFTQAGRRAEAAARYGEARVLMEQAARCHDEAREPAAAFDTRLALADLLMEASEFESTRQVLDGLEAGAVQADQRVRIVMQRMQLLSRQDAIEAAVQLGQETLADPVLQEDATALRIAQLRWTLAMCLRMLGDGPGALGQLALAEPLLGTSPDATWRCWFHSQRAATWLLAGTVGDALQAQATATAAAREVGRHRMLAGCLQNGSTIGTACGQLVEAMDMLDECLSLMADTGGGDAFTQHVRVQRARLLLWLGRYHDALAALESLAESADALAEYNRGRVFGSLLELWTHLGQPHRARAAQAALTAVPRDRFERQIIGLVEEEVAWLSDQPLPPAHTEVFALSQGPSFVNLSLARVQGWRRQADPGDVDTLASEAGRLHESGLQGLAAAVQVLAASWSARLGRAADAARHAEDALSQLRRTAPAGLYRPWLFLTLVHATEGHEALRTRALREGTQWVRNVARFQVPASYRASFLQHNRVNRELLALADAGA